MLLFAVVHNTRALIIILTVLLFVAVPMIAITGYQYYNHDD